MIIFVVGGIGSGKSVLLTKMIVDSSYHSFANYSINHDNASRIKKEDIVKREQTGTKKSGEAVFDMKMNFEYWKLAQKKYGNYHILLDEAHIVLNSRQSGTKWNTLITMWGSQVRKVLGTNEETHLILATQKYMRVDVAYRDLCHMLIEVTKIKYDNILVPTKMLNKGKLVKKDVPLVIVKARFFAGNDPIATYNIYKADPDLMKPFTLHFCANDYFRFYDSYEVFEDTPYL